MVDRLDAALDELVRRIAAGEPPTAKDSTEMARQVAEALAALRRQRLQLEQTPLKSTAAESMTNTDKDFANGNR